MSLNLRIILSATMVLVIFISLIAAALDKAFYDSTESALKDRLTSQLYALLAAAEVDNDDISMPSSELDALLGLPSSGVYAFITNAEKQTVWQSSSALGANPPPPVSLSGGEQAFNKITYRDIQYFTYAYGVNWATETDKLALTFNIITDLKSFDKQIQEYRTTLWGWLVAMALLLLVSQAAILRWGLLPLRRVGQELNRIETGDQAQIQQSYPQEIEHLTRNINLLLQQERDQKTRYRNALGDLAHSLKTPLAVLQNGLGNIENSSDSTLKEQVSRMNSIVEYQLQRAATAGASSIGKSIDVNSVCERMLSSLQKVYKDRDIQLEINIEKSLMFKGDEGDLMELLGNLLDNAFKWSRTSIRLIAQQQKNKLSICVCDDGPGFAEEKIESLLKRGVRADQTTPGHGIGLSIVGNIVDAYQGHMHINKSTMGGAEVCILL